MQVNPYLNFNGQCEEAFKFYEKLLNGKLESSFAYEGSPMASEAPAGWGRKLMHASLRLGNDVIMGADATPDRYQKPQGYSLSISVKAMSEAERIFKELSQGGAVNMPLQKTFWAAGFGMLVDRFGIPWMINCEAAG